MAAGFLRQFFYGVAEGCAWHRRCVGIEESQQGREVALADFAEHPACGFVDERVGMGEILLGQSQCDVKVSVGNQRQGAHYGYAFAPEVTGSGEGEEDCGIGLGIEVGPCQPLAYDLGA